MKIWKKNLIAGLITATIMFSTSACSNKDWIDTNLTYNKAIIF